MGRNASNEAAPAGAAGNLTFVELLQCLARLQGETVTVRVLSPSGLVPVVDWSGALDGVEAVDAVHWRTGPLCLSSREFVEAGYLLEPGASDGILFLDQGDLTVELAGAAIRELPGIATGRTGRRRRATRSRTTARVEAEAIASATR